VLCCVVLCCVVLCCVVLCCVVLCGVVWCCVVLCGVVCVVLCGVVAVCCAALHEEVRPCLLHAHCRQDHAQEGPDDHRRAPSHGQVCKSGMTQARTVSWGVVLCMYLYVSLCIFRCVIVGGRSCRVILYIFRY